MCLAQDQHQLMAFTHAKARIQTITYNDKNRIIAKKKINIVTQYFKITLGMLYNLVFLKLNLFKTNLKTKLRK
jgi:hypothetical protein